MRCLCKMVSPVYPKINKTVEENPPSLKEIVSDSCGSLEKENVFNSCVFSGSYSFKPPICTCIIFPITSTS